MTTALVSPHLFDVLDPQMLRDMLDAGCVRKQVHPTEPYTILNYTEKAAYDGVWNNVTRRCRGLIYNHETHQVVARPFPKFFNHGQVGAPELDLDRHVIVTDKADGSLGIIYPTRDGWAVATRGSFASEQAIHATTLLATRYPEFAPPEGTTVLVEIVYPENRIVLDYAGMDDLILLGAVDIRTGKSVPPDWAFLDWPGPRVEIFDYTRLADALAAEPRPNAEGLVVHFLASDERLKIKQADYVILHRIVTGLNARTVWQHLVDDKPLADLIEPLPDEFHAWVREVAEGITTGIVAEAMRLHGEYWSLHGEMSSACRPDDRASRAEFAQLAGQHPDRWAMFMILDGKDIRPKLLANAKPEAYVTPSGRVFTEETA